MRIPCASGQSTDPYREVTYPLYGAYRRFEATVRAVGSAPRETRIQVEVFAAQQRQARIHVPIGQSDDISADLSGSTLTLRLTCMNPDGIAELDEALLRR